MNDDGMTPLSDELPSGVDSFKDAWIEHEHPDAQTLMDELARRLTERFGSPCTVDVSMNGDDDWTLPVYVACEADENAYGLCDLYAAPLDAQYAFLAEQLEETLGSPEVTGA